MKIRCGSALVLVAWWFVAAAGDCDVTLGDDSYTEEILVSRAGHSRSLAVDYSTETVYFSSFDTLLNDWYNAKVDLRSKAFTVIEELHGECTFTVDQVRGYVHAGCGNDDGAPRGLFRQDSNSGHFKLTQETVPYVDFVYYYNDTLYYSFYTGHLLRTITYGRGVSLSPPSSAVVGLVVDAQGDFIFNNYTGVFWRQGDGAKEIRYKGFNYWMKAMALNSTGSVYTCDTDAPSGIWILHNRATSATKLTDVRCTALTFDADDNMIYGDYIRENIVRLVKCQRPLIPAPVPRHDHYIVK